MQRYFFFLFILNYYDQSFIIPLHSPRSPCSANFFGLFLFFVRVTDGLMESHGLGHRPEGVGGFGGGALCVVQCQRALPPLGVILQVIAIVPLIRTAATAIARTTYIVIMYRNLSNPFLLSINGTAPL